MTAIARAVHLRIVASAEKQAALLSFLREARPYYEAIPGARVRLLQDERDASRFIELVEYETEEAYAADAERVASDPLMLAYLARWRALLDGPAQVETFVDITSQITCAQVPEDKA